MSKQSDLNALVTSYTTKDATLAARGKYILRLVTTHGMSARDVANYVTANVEDFRLNHVEVTTHVNTRKSLPVDVTDVDYATAYRAVKSAVRDGDTPRKTAILDALKGGKSVTDAVADGEGARTKGGAGSSEPKPERTVTAEDLLKRLDTLIEQATKGDAITARAFADGFIARAAALGAADVTTVAA